MRYVMKQHWIAMGNDFSIQDETGADRFLIDGKVFTIGDKLSFQDLAGRELALIRQKLLSFGRTYEVYRNDRLAATVHKRPFTLFRDVFTMEDAAPGDLDAVGDFLDHEYRFTRDGRTVATVSKHFFAWTDTYGIEIADGEDDVLLLSMAVVIDLCSHDD